jgi:hypothetical protein
MGSFECEYLSRQNGLSLENTKSHEQVVPVALFSVSTSVCFLGGKLEKASVAPIPLNRQVSGFRTYVQVTKVLRRFPSRRQFQCVPGKPASASRSSKAVVAWWARSALWLLQPQIQRRPGLRKQRQGSRGRLSCLAAE